MTASSHFNDRTEDLEALAGQLVAKGILCESHDSARELSVSPIALPASILDAESVSISLVNLMLYAPSFLLSCLTADRRLRRRTFEYTVHCVRALGVGIAVPPHPSIYKSADASCDVQCPTSLVPATLSLPL